MRISAKLFIRILTSKLEKHERERRADLYRGRAAGLLNCSHNDFMDCLATSVIFDAEGRVAIPDMTGYGSRFKKKKESPTYEYNAMRFAVGGDGKERRVYNRFTT